MPNKTLWIVRGLPESGKSTIAAKLAPLHNYAADDYFEQRALANGTSYAEEWSSSDLEEAHMWCRARCAHAMQDAHPDVAVHNTFVERAHIQPYLDLAQKYGYTVHVMVVEKNHNNHNDHKIPAQSIQRMASKWQHVDVRFNQTPAPAPRVRGQSGQNRP